MTVSVSPLEGETTKSFIAGATIMRAFFGCIRSISHARITFVRRLSAKPPETLANVFAVNPAAKFYMQYLGIPLPRLNPLVFVLVNGIDIGERRGRLPWVVRETGRRGNGPRIW
jgi:hypothetical protein